MTKRILVLPGATEKFRDHVVNQIKTMNKEDVLMVPHDVKLYDIDGEIDVLSDTECDSWLKRLKLRRVEVDG